MQFVWRWLPVVAWSAVILAASSDLFSAERSGSVLRAILGHELPHLLHVAVRKLGHLLAYGFLGILALRAARSGGLQPADGSDGLKPVATSVIVVLLVAVIDEWHQSTLASRSGSPWDVLLDVVGGALAIAFLRARMTAANSSKESP